MQPSTVWISRLRLWWSAQPEWVRADAAIGFMLLLLGCVYVGNAWSPSSYGHVLQLAGAQDTGVVWGEPRSIRSDEWSVTTPLTQATVNNGLQRFNATSYYNEDLRSNYGMPIRDWGMVFKPAYWGYLFLPPAWAFSLSYFTAMAIFLVGYAHLFGLLGMRGPHAYLVSASLYFCGIVQFSWISNTSLFAFFPWIVLALCAEQPAWRRWLAFYWVSVCWLLGNFYPPVFISLAFVALALLAAYRPDLLRPRSSLPILLATVLACGTAVLYLWDYLSLTISTLYPGQRTSVAGYYPRFMVLTQLWPAELFNRDFKESVDFTNVAGLGTVGLYCTGAALCFLQWSDWRKLFGEHKRATLTLALAWFATLLWMITPVPVWVGRLLLWNRVPPERMAYASGLLLVFVVLHMTRVLGLRINRRKMGLYAALITTGGLLFEYWTRPLAGTWQHAMDWLVGPLMIGGWVVGKRLRASDTTTVLVVGAVCGVVVFGRFNALQSAVPIFNHAPNPLTQTLAANLNAEGVLAVQREGVIGATFNGMGFRSVSHLAVTPPMALWEDKFGPLSAPEKLAFNRYAHVRTVAVDRPIQIANDQVGVPAHAFREQPQLEMAAPGTVRFSSEGGYVDTIQLSNHVLTIDGWAPWTSKGARRKLIITTSVHTGDDAKLYDRERWDVVAATKDPQRLLSGFTVRLAWPHGAESLQSLCIFAMDEGTSKVALLGRPDQPETCKRQAKMERDAK